MAEIETVPLLLDQPLSVAVEFVSGRIHLAHLREVHLKRGGLEIVARYEHHEERDVARFVLWRFGDLHKKRRVDPGADLVSGDYLDLFLMLTMEHSEERESVIRW
jgi:hypothetical protein